MPKADPLDILDLHRRIGFAKGAMSTVLGEMSAAIENQYSVGPSKNALLWWHRELNRAIAELDGEIYRSPLINDTRASETEAQS